MLVIRTVSFFGSIAQADFLLRCTPFRRQSEYPRERYLFSGEAFQDRIALRRDNSMNGEILREDAIAAL